MAAPLARARRRPRPCSPKRQSYVCGVTGCRHAEVVGGLADAQPFRQHQVDGGLPELTCVRSHRGHETRSFWRGQSRRLEVSTIRVEVHGLLERNPADPKTGAVTPEVAINRPALLPSVDFERWSLLPNCSPVCGSSAVAAWHGFDWPSTGLALPTQDPRAAGPAEGPVAGRGAKPIVARGRGRL
jgi:hypothetical protein